MAQLSEYPVGWRAGRDNRRVSAELLGARCWGWPLCLGHRSWPAGDRLLPARLLGCPLRLEDGHGQVVVPSAAAMQRVSEPSLDDEAASDVGGDSAAVVGEDAETDPVQAEMAESPDEREADRSGALRDLSARADVGRISFARGVIAVDTGHRACRSVMTWRWWIRPHR